MAYIYIVFIGITLRLSLVANAYVLFLPTAPSISMPGLGQKEGWVSSASALRHD